MKKRIYALMTSLTLFISALSTLNVLAADNAENYYARGFTATDNGCFWAGCAQISWFNPAEKPEQVALYASGPEQTEGDYVLLGDDYDTTANASIVTTLDTSNWQVTPRDGWYNFKLVSTFADHKTTEQTIDFYVPNDGNENWYITTEVSDDFNTQANRGGWCYTNNAGNHYDFFPMGTSVVYDNGNPVLKVWSNAHIMPNTEETRDGKTNDSGN